MFTTATDLHYSGFLSFFAIFAAVLAAFFRRTVTRWVGTGSFVRFVGHELMPPRLQVGLIHLQVFRQVYARPHRRRGQDGIRAFIQVRFCNDLFQHSREPMNDIKRQLPIVDAGTIHAERHFAGTRQLR